MSRFLKAGVVVLAALATGSCCCGDDLARHEIQEMKDALNPWLVSVHAWHQDVRNAICQLEFDVYNVADSDGDTRTAGPVADPGSNRLCTSGPGDSDGQPPAPPQL